MVMFLPIVWEQNTRKNLIHFALFGSILGKMNKWLIKTKPLNFLKFSFGVENVGYIDFSKEHSRMMYKSLKA